MRIGQLVVATETEPWVFRAIPAPTEIGFRLGVAKLRAGLYATLERASSTHRSRAPEIGDCSLHDDDAVLKVPKSAVARITQ